jgi:predicted dithiol-disulfide oxidoreductase (DUF899 family)
MGVTFPGESLEYRRARDELLQSEKALRRQLEEVAALRRRLPLGGRAPRDYEFDEAGTDASGSEGVSKVRLSQLFEGRDSLLVYSYMFGPAMSAPCPSCTSILDGLDGVSPHVRQRVAFAVVARSPIERIRAVARERGWRNLRLLSSSRNSYNADYLGEDSGGDQQPVMNVFTRRGSDIHHFYATELLWAPSEPGQDGRHVDLVWPLWNLLDLTPEGRGETWNPRLRYEEQVVDLARKPAGGRV